MKIKNKLIVVLAACCLSASSVAFSQQSASLGLTVLVENQSLTPSIRLVNSSDQPISDISFGMIDVDATADHYRAISNQITAEVEHSGTWEVRIYSNDDYSLTLPTVNLNSADSIQAYETAIANNLFLKTGTAEAGNDANVLLRRLINETVINVGTENVTTFAGPTYDDPDTTGVVEEEIPDYTNDDHWNESEVFGSVFDITTTGLNENEDAYVPFYRTLTDAPATTEGKTDITFQLAVDAENTPSSSQSSVSYGRNLTVELYIE